jgi:hypothetical protein
VSGPFTPCPMDLGRPCYDGGCMRWYGCKREHKAAHPRFQPVIHHPPKEPGGLHRARWEAWWTLQSYEAREAALRRAGFGITFRTWGWDDLPSHVRDQLLLCDPPRSMAAKDTPRE